VARRAVSSVEATLVVCIVLALGISAAFGFYNQGQAGRGIVLIALGLFALATAIWSRLRQRRDEDL
jgi:hypothetical protein